MRRRAIAFAAVVVAAFFAVTLVTLERVREQGWASDVQELIDALLQFADRLGGDFS